MGQSIWQSMEKKGYSRRDFLQFCGAAAATAGFGKAGVAQVVSAFEKKEKPAVVWMHFQECTCCSESFIRASHPIVADALLDVLSLNYTETLMAASGFQAEKSLSDTIKNNKGKYIVLVEGAVPTKDGGVYCMIGGKTAESILQEVSKDAAAIVAWGSLRFKRLRAGRQAESDRCHANSQAGEQAGDQRARMPADCRRDDGGGDAPAGAGPVSGAGQPGPAQGVLRTARARHLLSPAELRCRPLCRVVRRRERAQGILPVQDGLQGTGDVQRLLGGGVERRHELPRFSRATVASDAAKKASGTTDRCISTWPGSPASASRARQTRSARSWRLTTLAGVAAHAIVTNIRKKQVIAEVHAEDQKES